MSPLGLAHLLFFVAGIAWLIVAPVYLGVDVLWTFVLLIVAGLPAEKLLKHLLA